MGQNPRYIREIAEYACLPAGRIRDSRALDTTLAVIEEAVALGLGLGDMAANQS